jgi:hypothetical protein
VKRAWEDEAFRKEFTADPAGAFVKYLGVPAASLPTISVHQEEPGSWHIVLPAKPADTDELSEEYLEKVAGGSVIPWSIAASLAASGAAASLLTATSAIVAAENSGW